MIKSIAAKAGQQESSAKDREKAAEKLRQALRSEMFERKMNPTALAEAAGLPTPNAIYNFLNGRTKSLAVSTCLKIAGAMPGCRLDVLLGIVEDAAGKAPERKEDVWQREAREQAISNIDASFSVLKKGLSELQLAALHCSSHVTLLEARLDDFKHSK